MLTRPVTELTTNGDSAGGLSTRATNMRVTVADMLAAKGFDVSFRFTIPCVAGRTEKN